MSRTVRPVHNQGLGWEPDVDENDRLFPMAAVLAAEELLYEAPLPTSRFYNTGPILNQGKTSMCVGFSSRQYLVTDPIINNDKEPSAQTIYCEARKRDPWEGDCADGFKQGTSIRAGMKYLQEIGLVQTYVWAWDAETIRKWILSGKGPVVVGTRWYSSMDKTVGGRIVVKTTSIFRGGHAYLISGYDDKKKLFRITNSWGTGWGQQGHATMRYADLQTLLQLQGEGVTAVEIDKSLFIGSSEADDIITEE